MTFLQNGLMTERMPLSRVTRLSPEKLITLLPVGLDREPELNTLISEGRRSESAEKRGERR